jgi:predicted metal-binding transcription factor (methanogenesis marker protein 9)
MGDDVVGRAFYELAAHDEKLDRDLDDAERKVKASAQQGASAYEKAYTGASQKVSASFGNVRNALAAIGIGIGLTTVMSFFGGAIGAASDLNEEVSKAGVVFGASAGKVEDFAERADKALGQSKQQALAAAGGFGNMFRTIGFAEGAAADMSLTMVQLASDMASFNNQDPSEMLVRLRSGLSGEAEPLRQFGVLLSEARVAEEAYATGITARGAALTEAQKVQARYSLILKDTALQQGDFARTADGLANSQRIQAAVMENSMARIGQALLPLAKELTQFATDVLPGVADGLTDLLHAAAPLLGMFLALGKLWLEQAGVIVPLLIAAVGVKLVAAFFAARAAATGFGMAAKSAWAAALLGLPLLFEGIEAATNAASDFFTELAHGKEGVDTLHKLTELVGNEKFANELLEWGYSAEEFARVVTAAGGDAEAAFKAIEEQADHSSTAVIAAFRRAAREAADAASAGDAAKQTAARLREGAGEVADGAREGITDPIVNAAADARKKAAEEARRIPAEIAAAIIEGRDLVIGAAEGLSSAATDPLLQQARITEIRAQMKDLANVTAEELKKATTATIAADKLKYAQLEIQLAGYLLRADPMSKEAMSLLAKYANSEDPATRAAYDALMTAIEDRAFIMANDVEAEAERAGIAPEEAFRRHKAEAAEQARAMAAGIVKMTETELGTSLKDDAYSWGLAIIKAWAAGLSAGGSLYVPQATLDLAGSVKQYLQGESPPKKGPLRDIDKWGYNIGRAWAMGLGKGAGAGDVLGLLGGPQLALAGVGLGSNPVAGAAPAPTASGDTIFQLHYNGRESSFSSPYDLIDELARMGAFSDGRLG